MSATTATPWIAESKAAMVESLLKTPPGRCGTAVGFVVKRTRRSVVIEMANGQQFTINCHGVWLVRCPTTKRYGFTLDPADKHGLCLLVQTEIADDLTVGYDRSGTETVRRFKE